MDVIEFRKRGKDVIDAIADYYEHVQDMPPLSNVEPGYLYPLLPKEAPKSPESFESLQKDVQEKIMPGITHWQSGNFFGWYPCNSSFPAMLGDMYSNMINIVGFNWICSPAATELEIISMDWLAKLLGLNERFWAIKKDGSYGKGGGIIQGSASEAHIVALVAARDMALERLMEQGMAEPESKAQQHKLVAYFSDQTHCSGQKSANVVGCHVNIIPTGDDLRLTKGALQTAINEDRAAGLIPFFVCGTFGTTNTAAIDDLAGIADVAEAEHLWFHIDAAYAGSALTCPELRPLAVGAERADSFDFNPSKWMLTNFECSPMWVADSKHLVKALSINGDYVPRGKTATPFARDYRDWQLPFGHKFRAMKLWFVMRMFGESGIRQHIRQHIQQAKWLEQQLVEDGRFEIMAPVVFGLVVFRIKPSSLMSSNRNTEAVNNTNANLVKLINSDGRVFISGSQLHGTKVARAAIGSTSGTQANVELLLEVIKETAAKVLRPN